MTTEDDRTHRWAEADAIARGELGPEVTQGVRRRRTRTWLLIVTVLVVLMVLTGLLAYVLAAGRPDSASAESSDPLWAAITGLILAAIGLFLIGFGIFQTYRSGMFGGRWRAAVSALPAKDRRDVRREILGRRPLDPAHLLVARDLAGRTTRTNGLLWMYGGVLLGQVGHVLLSPGPWRYGLLALLTLCFSIAGLSMRRDADRARSFLDRHPAVDHAGS